MFLKTGSTLKSFIFFEVVFILRLVLILKDTTSKLRIKEVFNEEAKKKWKRKETLKKLDGFWSKNYLEILISTHACDLVA